MTHRERFLALLARQSAMPGDVFVLLAGEDATPRMDTTAALFRRGFAPRIVVTGGRDQPPRWRGADEITTELVGHYGISPDRITTDNAAENTHEQAVNIAHLALSEAWTSILLVASGYHLYRAHLTFLRALHHNGLDDTVRIVPVAANAPWFAAPEGVLLTRSDLLSGDLDKIELYGVQGHCATYSEGLAYLKAWEGRV